MPTRRPAPDTGAPQLRPAGQRFGYGAASVVPYLLEGRLRAGTLLLVVDGQNAVADERLRPHRRRR